MIVATVPFADALKDVSAGNTKIPQAEFLADGQLAVVDQGQSLVAGFTDDPGAAVRSSGPLIVFGDHTRVIKFIDFPFAMGADGVKVLQVRDGFEPKFVYHYLRSRQVPSAGYSRHFKFLKEIEVPRPSLPEQQRIVAILDHADALRAKRRQVLAHLETLTQSLCSDFFCRPARFARPLAAVAAKVVVGHVGPTSAHFRTSGIPFLRTGNVGRGRVVRDDMAHVTPEFHQSLLKSRLQTGDVVISRVISDEIRAAILPADLDGSNCANIIIVRPSDQLLPTTVLGYLSLSSTQRQLLGRRVGSAQGVVNTTVLKELSIPMHPVPLQKVLADKLRSVDLQSAAVERAITTDDELFASLQARAFAGEL